MYCFLFVLFRALGLGLLENFHLVPEYAPLISWLDGQKLSEFFKFQNALSVTCLFLGKQFYFMCDNLENVFFVALVAQGVGRGVVVIIVYVFTVSLLLYFSALSY
jgi:hypothetical protein